MTGHKLKQVKRASGGRPAKIYREQILEIARQLGAGEFTFNNIAERLGVRTTALYYHFDSREELLNALALELAKEFASKPGNPKRWKPWLEETALRFYDFLLANPAMLEVENWRGFAMFGMPLVESVLKTLEGAGYSLIDAGRIWELVSNRTYLQARILKDVSKAAPFLAGGNAVPQTADTPPRMRAWTATLNNDPRKQLAETLHWLLAALPQPRR
ncbi:MAG: TetR/AcrR family transcriptional regulator [Stenotrophobium sp.]